MGGDQPLFAVDQVRYLGQSIAMVLAKTEQDATDIALYVTKKGIGYTQIVSPTLPTAPRCELLAMFRERTSLRTRLTMQPFPSRCGRKSCGKRTFMTVGM